MSFAAPAVCLLLACLLVGAMPTSAHAMPLDPGRAPVCADPVLNVVAHPDDDLLFLSPDLLHDIEAGRCVRTVVTTAGDGGEGSAYWMGLEQGLRAAYAAMATVPDVWAFEDAGVPGRPIPRFRLLSTQVSLVFLRLPDGNLSGEGYATYGHQSLLDLWTEGTSVQPLDGSPPYLRSQLQAMINWLVTDLRPATIRTTDWVTYFDRPADHSDHWTTAQLVVEAHRADPAGHQLIGYETYTIDELPANVAGADLEKKVSAFQEFARYDPATCSAAPGTCPVSPHADWLQRQYVVAAEPGLGTAGSGA
jgi:LmbE family N-acetylglucosaminyl deacetylase